jgi:uncharacterized protein YpiB (UPF0302 family)
MRQSNIFNYLIKQHELIQNVLFIDDKTENTDAALHWDFKFEFTSRQRRCGTTI